MCGTITRYKNLVGKQVPDNRYIFTHHLLLLPTFEFYKQKLVFNLMNMKKFMFLPITKYCE